MPGAERWPGSPSPHIPMETSALPPRLAPALDYRSAMAALVQAASHGVKRLSATQGHRPGLQKLQRGEALSPSHPPAHTRPAPQG